MRAIPNTTGKIETLRYQAQRWIDGPTKVKLKNDDLLWQYEGVTGEWLFEKRSVEGCLDDFVLLEDGSPEDVLSFVQKRGVLGAIPLVQILRWDSMSGDHWFPDNFFYKEPVFLYTQTARSLGCILKVMKALKAGYAIEDEVLEGCFGPEFPRVAKTSGASVRYRLLYYHVIHLWKASTTKIGVFSPDIDPGLDEAGCVSVMSEPTVFELRFGDWVDGLGWDQSSYAHTRGGDMVVAAPQEVAFASNDPRGCEDYLTSCGYRQSDTGEWLKLYHQHVRDNYSFDLIPHRPSALFNVLIFQLLQVITLPSKTFFCSQCDRLYQYDEDKTVVGGKLPKGKDSKTWGNSKPRKGRETAFCCEDCRREYKRVVDNERYENRCKQNKPADQC